MNTYRFAEVPSNESVATMVSFVVSGWLLLAAAAILLEPSVDEQARAGARTPQVTVRELSVTEAPQQHPDVRFAVEVVGPRAQGGVS